MNCDNSRYSCIGFPTTV